MNTKGFLKASAKLYVIGFVCSSFLCFALIFFRAYQNGGTTTVNINVIGEATGEAFLFLATFALIAVLFVNEKVIQKVVGSLVTDLTT